MMSETFAFAVVSSVAWPLQPASQSYKSFGMFITLSPFSIFATRKLKIRIFVQKIDKNSGYLTAIRHILEDVIEIGVTRDETRVKNM